MQYTALWFIQIGVYRNSLHTFINICHWPNGYIFTAPNSCIYQILISILLQPKWCKSFHESNFVVVFFLLKPSHCCNSRQPRTRVQFLPSKICNYCDNFPTELFQQNLTVITWQFSNETCQFTAIGLNFGMVPALARVTIFLSLVFETKYLEIIRWTNFNEFFMNCSYQNILTQNEQEKNNW